jgi:hypothetical protein
MLVNLAAFIEKAKLVIPYDEDDRLKPLKTELRFYKLDDKGLSTDCVLSLALAAYAWKRRDSNIDGGGLDALLELQSGFSTKFTYPPVAQEN